MRYVCLISFLALMLSGCAERTVTFVYYPKAPPNDRFPPLSEFEAEAQAECARYGLTAVHAWDNVTTFQRYRATWRCVQR